MDFKALECRVKPVKLTQYKIEQEGSNVVKSKKTKEYDYYLCDKCREKIVMTNKNDIDFVKFDDKTIIKIERIGSNGWYTVYEKEKELLTEEEIKPFQELLEDK